MKAKTSDVSPVGVFLVIFYLVIVFWFVAANSQKDCSFYCIDPKTFVAFPFSLIPNVISGGLTYQSGNLLNTATFIIAICFYSFLLYRVGKRLEAYLDR